MSFHTTHSCFFGFVLFHGILCLALVLVLLGLSVLRQGLYGWETRMVLFISSALYWFHGGQGLVWYTLT